MEALLSRRRVLALAAAVPLVSRSCSDQLMLVCQHQRTGEVYHEAWVASGTEVTHSWVHSVELSRWTDSYRCRGKSLILTSTEFHEYGNGMPLDEGDLTIRKGKFVIENIDRPFDAIRWIHSRRADYRVGIDGNEKRIPVDNLPAHEPLELRLI